MNAKNYWHCFLLCLCFCSCSSKESRFLEGLDAGVRFAQEKQPATVDFRDLTDFDWDKVFVFGPYTSPGTIQSDLGYEWPEATRTNIQESDGIALVVFVRDGRVTEHFSVPRSIADFTDLHRKHVFPREEAVFAVGRLTEVVDSNERTRFTLITQDGKGVRAEWHMRLDKEQGTKPPAEPPGQHREESRSPVRGDR